MRMRANGRGTNTFSIVLKSSGGPGMELTARGLVDPDDAVEIGMKVVEMADRCRAMDMVAPGATATWYFEVDDVRYSVSVAVAPGS